MVASAVVSVDTNAIIEAVRTACWAAITGRFRIETVRECCDEALRGDATRQWYVPVTPVDLDRLAAIHEVSEVDRARLALAYERAYALDGGERDLFAHALSRGDGVWVLCSPDKASVRAAVVLGCVDELVSLEDLARQAGVRPSPALAGHHSQARLSQWRTAALLGTL